ncbi:diguanylate cyclase [Candidatus Poribacteria bacterium]|nr:diguanylate cyclase [Candidatus Poribacteria bacterium]
MARILVVDDDKLVLQLFIETLSEEGYNVDGASSGTEALDLLRRNQYEVILTDLKLPEMSGIEILKKAKSKDPNVEVIIITAYGTIDLIVEAVREGAYDFIVKPAELSRISLAVKNALTKRSLERELKEAIRKHQELYEMAVRDPLTGLYNQRYFRDLMGREINKGGTLSLVMFDLDNFKYYNDTHGHLKGDQLLKDIAKILESNRRSTDIVARYGGDEFTIILPGTTKENAERFAWRCVREVENHHFKGEEVMPKGKVTMSGGVASFPEDAIGAEELVEKADKACYWAKEMGRNRVMAYERREEEDEG